MTIEFEIGDQFALAHSDDKAPVRGRPFPKGTSGNPLGRQPGSRNKSTLMVQAILDEALEVVTEKTISVALAGNPLALRLCLERMAPRPRDSTIALELPPVRTATGCADALAAVIAAVAAGQITPAHGQAMLSLIDGQRKNIEAVELETRLDAIERKLPK